MLRFDQLQLRKRLAALAPKFRVVFAAACAERLAPAYRLFAGEHSDRARMLEKALAILWSSPEPSMPAAALEGEIESIIGITPQEDEFEGEWTQGVTNAQNAGMATVYALRSRLSMDVDDVAWAAQVAYEAIDNFVINEFGIDAMAADGEIRVLSEDRVQAELARQQADLSDLEKASAESYQAVVERIRQRARASAASFFQLSSTRI